MDEDLDAYCITWTMTWTHIVIHGLIFWMINVKYGPFSKYGRYDIQDNKNISYILVGFVQLPLGKSRAMHLFKTV